MQHKPSPAPSGKQPRTASVSREFFTDQDLAARYGVDRTTIWRWSRNQTIPQPVRFSGGCTRWRRADIEAADALRGAK